MNARERALEVIQDVADVGREDAEAILAVYQRHKVIKFEGRSGGWSFAHGAFGERTPMLNALAEARGAR